MTLQFDDDIKIKEGKRDSYLSRLMRLATQYDNHDYVVILKKAGLSSYISTYENNLTPFQFNGPFKNSNYTYIPEEVFDELYNEIGTNKQYQYLFLKAIIEQISSFDRSDIDFDLLQRYLLLLGFQIVETIDTETKGYSLVQVGITDSEVFLGGTIFENILSEYGNARYYYDQANSTFINGDYNSTISSCRALLEIVCNIISGREKVANSIFKLSNVAFNDERGNVQDVNQAINYWANTKKDVSMFIRLYSLYNFLCEYGSHPSKIPNFHIAFWMLNETKTTIYYLHNMRYDK